MPVNVWKCDHCEQTFDVNESFEVISEHEKKCPYNPETKPWIYNESHSKKGVKNANSCLEM